MRISMKSDYSLRAIIDLARLYGQGPIQSGDIASRQDIPEPYLDQLLTILRKAGLIKSVRGPLGGHSLARSPEEITVGEVIAVIEGSIAPLDCVQESNSCSRSRACAQRDLWTEINSIVWKALDSTTIATLLQRQIERDSQTMYYI
ncbi:MAG: Rrf2 family transcriptional regulator [Chloroflexi bacterium]|nr:Rrf2 family transcriptional regulator [Chloroflexota bacterium]